MPSADSVDTKALLELAVYAQRAEQAEFANAVAERAPAGLLRSGFIAGAAAVGAHDQLFGLSHHPRLGGRPWFRASPGRS